MQMKTKGLLNPFSDKTRELFIFTYSCWDCGMSKPLTLHHIYKRISNSPMNSAPVCQECHDKSNIHSRDKRAKFMNKTIKFLQKQDYKLTKKDREFLKMTQ